MSKNVREDADYVDIGGFLFFDLGEIFVIIILTWNTTKNQTICFIVNKAESMHF